MMTEVQCILNHNLQYNKDNIEKILYSSTGKNIEALLSRANTHEHNSTCVPATGELVERIHTYLSIQKETAAQNSKYYLVINCNQNEMVDIAYLGNLHYSNKHTIWKYDILPLTHHKPIVHEYCHLSHTLIEDVQVRFDGPEIYQYINMIEAYIPSILEHTTLRMKYFILNRTNFEEYKHEFIDIYSQPVEDLVKTHKSVLTHAMSEYDSSLQAMDQLQNSYNELSISGAYSDYDPQA